MARKNQSNASRKTNTRRDRRRGNQDTRQAVTRGDRHIDESHDIYDNRPRSGYGGYVNPRVNKFEPLNDNQRMYYGMIMSSDLTFALGPPGTAKSYCAIAAAHRLFMDKAIERIILTKPHFEVGEKLGTTPGDLNDKISHIVRPMRVILEKFFGKSHLEYLVLHEKIVFEHLGNIVGLTYDDALVIVDEAQNTTKEQMKAILTRTGKNTRYVVCGDYKEQKYAADRFGLEDAITRLGSKPGVSTMEFTLDDVVRSAFCKLVIEAYRN